MGASLISNPPYNLRWKNPELAGFLPQYVGYEIPPESNANMAFVLSALNLVDHRAVIILPNNVMSSEQKQEKAIMRQLIKQNLLLAVISMPDKMFESTNIPTCILVFDKNKETREIAMVDMTHRCREAIRDQRGQFGGNSHTGRTYHKTVNFIPLESMSDGKNGKPLTERLKDLPSAQPEIVRCKDCKYRDADDFCTGRGYPNVLVPGDDFCSKAERRLDG